MDLDSSAAAIDFETLEYGPREVACPEPPELHPAAPSRRDELAEAFGEQYERLVAAAQRVLRDRSDAEDAVQDGFVSACRNLHRFREEARLSTWLYRIVINAALMRVRKRTRRNERALPEEAVAPLACEATQEERMARRQLAERVCARAGSLPEPQRELLADRYLRDLSLQSIASLRGISVAAAKTRVHRARVALRSLTGAECA
jgi:RNA polymerase sigma-70 factor (ECF subfamily)